MEMLNDYSVQERYNNLRLLYRTGGMNSLGYSIEALRIGEMPIHLCGELELLYVLNGSYNIKVSFNNYHLDTGDFLLLNPYELHRLIPTTKNNLILSLKINNKCLNNKLFAFDYDYYNRIDITNTELIKIKKKENQQTSLFWRKTSSN